MKLITRLCVALALVAGLTVTPTLASERRPLVSVSGVVKVLPSTDTLKTNATATGGASINIPHGTAPTSPNNGDFWTTTSGLFARVNGATVGPLIDATGAGGAITSKDEGSTLTSATTSFDFVGAGVTATNVGGAVEVNIAGGGGYSAEDARDDIGTALVAGAGIVITPNDGADTITVAASFSGASVKKSADQTSADYGTSQAVSWNTEILDVGGWHNFASTVTITIASPGVVSWTAHGFHNGTPIVFTTTGALPTGLTAGTTYFIVSAATDTFQVSATPGGAAINTSGSQSGVHTGTNTSIFRVPAGVSHVEVGANIRLANFTSTAIMSMLVSKNGVTTFDGTAGQSLVPGVSIPRVSLTTGPMAVAANDNLEIQLSSGADNSVDITASVSNWWVRVID